MILNWHTKCGTGVGPTVPRDTRGESSRTQPWPWPLNSASVCLSVWSVHLYWWNFFVRPPIFLKNISNRRYYTPLLGVLSKDLDWKSRSPRYWHLKVKNQGQKVKNGVAYEAKLLFPTTNFSENLCGGRSQGKPCLVLSKDVDWKSGSPRYWHLKSKA